MPTTGYGSFYTYFNTEYWIFIAHVLLIPSHLTSHNTPHLFLFMFSSFPCSMRVSVEASLDHPFFVFHSGWSSCSPELTEKKYNLKVRKLQVGDVCVSLTKKEPEPKQVTSANVPSQSSPSTSSTPSSMPSPTASAVPSTSAATPATVSQPSTSSDPSSSSANQPQQQQQLSPPLKTPNITGAQKRSSPTLTSEGETSASTPGSSNVPSGIWTKPAALRGAERQHSSDEAQKDEKDSGRKRRWSDPGQGT
ncbi:Ataxin 1 [Halocaridina rubra]|uniref:Ataxin 1 n=1 Tax=Halocaridina rubra TaxID=373956 RepID=A0AAN9A2N1_HALRR